jgi:NTP pyrophosphatase (non-canonical NTP hydrolase)
MSLPKKYEEFVRIGNFTKGWRDARFLAAMGLAGEAGEVCDMLKKHLLHDKALDKEELKLELGDVLWYLQHTCNTFGIEMEEVAEANIIKLCKRYPDQYGDPEEWITEW